MLGSWSMTGRVSQGRALGSGTAETPRYVHAPCHKRAVRTSQSSSLSQLTLPQAVYGGFGGSTSLSALGIRPLFSLTNIMIMKWTCTLVCLCISLVTNEVERLLIYSLLKNL